MTVFFAVLRFGSFLNSSPRKTAAAMKSTEVVATCPLEWLTAAVKPAEVPKLLAQMSANAATTRMEKR